MAVLSMVEGGLKGLAGAFPFASERNIGRGMIAGFELEAEGVG